MVDRTPQSAHLNEYPWYRQVTDGSVEQGDILFDFQCVKVTSSYADVIAENIEVDIEVYDVIVLTQSCDLANGKVENVILCPFFPPDTLKLHPNYKEIDKKGTIDQIKRGRREGLYMIPPCDIGTNKFGECIVVFRQAVTVPLDYVMAHANQQAGRVRLCPPYREHLAQAFARFIMRIGLPRDYWA